MRNFLKFLFEDERNAVTKESSQRLSKSRLFLVLIAEHFSRSVCETTGLSNIQIKNGHLIPPSQSDDNKMTAETKMRDANMVHD